MEENNKKTKAKKLSDAICRSLPRLDKRYYKAGDYPWPLLKYGWIIIFMPYIYL